MRIANLDWVRTPLLLEICKIPNQLEAEYRAYLDHEQVFQCPRCARSKQQLLAAVPNQNSCCWTWVGEWKAYQQYNCGMVCWKHFHFLMLGETRNAQVARVNFIPLEHMSCDMVDHVQCKIPKFKPSQVVHFLRITKQSFVSSFKAAVPN